MAYATRWTVPFKDINRTLRTIYIEQDGYTGNPTALTPGDKPLVWDEDASEDLTSRVRGITGRLQVIEHVYGDLSDLYPTTPLQLRVRCQNVFYGFIKVQNSTNPWTSGPRTLTLNVVSPLALAYDIPMPINHTLGMREVGDVMTELMNTLGYSFVTMPRGNVSELGKFFEGTIRGMLICPYADDKDYHYANDDEVFAPISCGEVLEMICERHSLMAHDSVESDSASLVLSRVGGDTNGMYRWSISDIEAGTYSNATQVLAWDASSHEVLTDFTVAGNSNSESLVHPYSYIDIKHEGEDGDTVHFPTPQSFYNPNLAPNYILAPRGIWLTNANANVKLGNLDLADSDNIWHKDALFFDFLSTGIAAGSLLFSVTFYNVDNLGYYRVKFKYAHKRDSGHDAIQLSARGSNGWYGVNPNVEVKYMFSLNGDAASSVVSPSTEYEVTTGMYIKPSDFVTLNFYVATNGEALTNLYITDVELERVDSSEATHERWEEQRFIERIIGSVGDKPLTINMRLNDTFFSNYYVTDYEFFFEYPTYFLNSQRRVQITVRAGELSALWYMYLYSLYSDNPRWRIIAISYDVRDHLYKLTLHRITNNY